MTPVFQRNRHRPDQGIYGDCHRACIASLLDKPLDDVPHFMDGLADSPEDGTEFARRQREYLLTVGFVPLQLAYACELPDLYRVQALLNPDTYYILGGRSIRGLNHSVLCLNDQMVHDPAGMHEGCGIHEPLSDGYYFVTFLGSIQALHQAGAP